MRIRLQGQRQSPGRGLNQAMVLALPLLFFACTTPPTPRHSARTGSSARTVYVVHHGALHTGLTVKRSDIPVGHWPASRDYSGNLYIEVGWGDDDGYRKPLTPGIAVKALMRSKRTVLLADGFSRAISAEYNDPKFTVLAVDLSEAGLARLCDHIQQTYALNERGQPIRLGQGWYRARGTYSAFNTCNTWVAAGLRKAGCPISPAMCLMPGQLLARVRAFARPIERSR
ncbi:MAG TPA: DUF2459 domain-containing protein [Chthoniobacterales bacterium]|nr:DUF2459 domain-containing protein [Chthoniobacterales bacterium]